jgi:hypothetical protein
MATKNDLMPWVLEALKSLGGSGSVAQVSRAVWQAHEEHLRQSGDLFYTWQYDIRWAAQRLRNDGRLKPATKGRGGGWAIAD